MNIELFREAVHRKPFEPFIIRLADGQSVAVSDPDLIAMGTRRIVVLGEVDGVADLDCDMIVSLEKPTK